MEHSIVAVTPAVKPIRVHLCHDQVTEPKPERCYCSMHVTNSQAEIMIANGEAYWLLVQRGEQKFEKHNAIVLTAAKVAEIKIESDAHVKEFREWLAKTDSDITLTADEVWAALTNPQSVMKRYRSLNQKLGFVYWLWETVLLKADLHPDRGMSMTLAPEGLGQIETGGYDAAKINEIAKWDDESLPAKPNRPSGHGPDADE